MISADKAKKIILKSILPLKETELLFFPSCLGRVLATNIKSKENTPSFNNSAMDGFALSAKDTSGASQQNPSVLEVIEDVPAGYVAKKRLKAGQAIRIMTGAPLPKGADCVVMVEETKKTEDRRQNTELIKIFRKIKPRENVRLAGEDVKKKELVIKKGALLKSGHIGMLASLGFHKIKVFRKPRVAILATGDELADIRKELKPGKIRNSNSYSLYAQVLKTGAIPLLLGIARDRPNELKQKIKKGLNCDMLLVSGGISVGDYDFVKDVLKDLGMEIKFWKVAMRPGKPLAFGKIGCVPIFGLPGNPVSSMVAFEQFVRPAILKMSGATDLFRFHLPAIIKQDVQKKKGLRYFLRVVLENRNGRLFASLTGPQGSGILKSMILANGIMELPEDVSCVRKGECVQVTYID
ncbi:MAG: molybdopterin molybdotransferase MoeA [Candidatus Omnitrophota bacterium]|nr:molybdopterin molybdotransferase MoeA [Candidatus Omnitrophota bacterium]